MARRGVRRHRRAPQPHGRWTETIARSTSGGGRSGAGSPCRGWRSALAPDLVCVIKPRFNVTLAERGAGAKLPWLGFPRWSPPPSAARETPKKLRRSGQGRHPRAWARTTNRTEHKKTFRNDRHEAGRRVTRAYAAHGRHWTKPAGWRTLQPRGPRFNPRLDEARIKIAFRGPNMTGRTYDRDHAARPHPFEEPHETDPRRAPPQRTTRLRQHPGLSRLDRAVSDSGGFFGAQGAVLLRHPGNADNGGARERVDGNVRRRRSGACAFGPCRDHARPARRRQVWRSYSRDRRGLSSVARLLRDNFGPHGGRDNLLRSRARRRDRILDPAEHKRGLPRDTRFAELRNPGCPGDRRARPVQGHLHDSRQHLGDTLVLSAACAGRGYGGRSRHKISLRPFRSSDRARVRQRGMVSKTEGHLRRLCDVRRSGGRFLEFARAAYARPPAAGGRASSARSRPLARRPERSRPSPASSASLLPGTRLLEARFSRLVGAFLGASFALLTGRARRHARRPKTVWLGVFLGRLREPCHSLRLPELSQRDDVESAGSRFALFGRPRRHRGSEGGSRRRIREDATCGLR